MYVLVPEYYSDNRTWVRVLLKYYSHKKNVHLYSNDDVRIILQYFTRIQIQQNFRIQILGHMVRKGFCNVYKKKSDHIY